MYTEPLCESWASQKNPLIFCVLIFYVLLRGFGSTSFFFTVKVITGSDSHLTGFDPFDESVKGLADLVAKENATEGPLQR